MDATQQYKKAEDEDMLKAKIKKAMLREYSQNKAKHDLNMVRRIVKYALKKHKNCPWQQSISILSPLLNYN